MAEYFDRYDWVLDQLALAGQSGNMIIVEPDMYGFLMRGPQGAIGKPVGFDRVRQIFPLDAHDSRQDRPAHLRVAGRGRQPVQRNQIEG